MSKFYSFNTKEVEEVIDSISKTTEGIQTRATESDFSIMDGGELQILAECIEVKVEEGKICFDLPLGIGKKCINIPVKFPNGELGKACLRICSTWGIPTGLEITITIKGVEIIKKVFGKC